MVRSYKNIFNFICTHSNYFLKNIFLIRIAIFVAYKYLFKMSFENHTIIQTEDGVDTLFLPELNETYHSKNGAFAEAQHVYLENGLFCIDKPEIDVLEIGFGTGLNAILTYLEAEKLQKKVNYTTVEAYPLSLELILTLNYHTFLSFENYAIFKNLHQLNWSQKEKISPTFDFKKINQKFEEIDIVNAFDVIYFDAFGYDVQPELWSKFIFQKMYNALKTNGILTTYACRTTIKKAMETVGFIVKKLPGAPGKREMLQGIKIDVQKM